MNYCFATFGKDFQGKLSYVQLTKLDDQGRRALTRGGEKLNKIQYGLSKASFVTLQQGKETDPVFVAEGVETALSIKEAGVKGKIVTSMGVHNISNYQTSEKNLILRADNGEYKVNSQIQKIIEKSKKRSHLKITLLLPLNPSIQVMILMILKKEGVKGIQNYVKEYVDSTTQKAIQNIKESGADRKPCLSIKIPEAKISNQYEVLLKYIDSKLKT